MTLLQIQLCQEALRLMVFDRRSMPADWQDYKDKFLLVAEAMVALDDMKPTAANE